MMLSFLIRFNFIIPAIASPIKTKDIAAMSILIATRNGKNINIARMFDGPIEEKKNNQIRAR